MSKWNSRKLGLWVASVVVMVWLLVEGYLPPENFQAIMMFLLPVYFFANVLEKKWGGSV